MNTVFYIAKRYAFSKSKTKAIHLITMISSIGIVVSSMALFVVLSIFSGLEQLTLSYIDNTSADLTAMPDTGKSLLVSEEQKDQIRKLDGIQAFSFVAEERVVFNYNEKQSFAYIKAVDSNYLKVADVETGLVVGAWITPGTAEVIIGNSFAHTLSMGLYSNDNLLEAIAMKPGEGMISVPEEAYNRIPLYPKGIYLFNNADLDGKYVFADIALGQQLLNWEENRYSQIEIKLDQGAKEKKVIAGLQDVFQNTLEIKNKEQLNSSLYKMLKTEKLAVYLIFCIVIVVTLFSLTGALIMMILEKKEHFRTLWFIGFTKLDLRRIVLYQGLILSLGGAFAGIVLGFGISYLQEQLGIIRVTEHLPYPVVIQWENFIVVFFTLVLLGLLASFFAASRLRIEK